MQVAHTSNGNPRSSVVWTVAGFDPSSGAGVTADLQTFASHGLFGCSAITALTVQNTAGVFGWEPVAPSLLEQTLQRLADDLPPLGIKIGMLGTAAAASRVAELLTRLRAERPGLLVVLDPVLRSSSGRVLYPDDALSVLRKELLPAVGWITPNWAELAVLSGLTVRSLQGASEAGRALLALFPGLHIVATGGEEETPTDLLLRPDGSDEVFRGEHVKTRATHGTGCAFSSALLCQLVQGATPEQAVKRAKAFVEGALLRAPGVGSGRGPMELLWPLRAPEAATKLLP